MNIESARYLQDFDGNNIAIAASIDGKTRYIPLKQNNRHYVAILEWVAEGNTIADAE